MGRGRISSSEIWLRDKYNVYVLGNGLSYIRFRKGVNDINRVYVYYVMSVG